jgi:hypothetical protein
VHGTRKTGNSQVSPSTVYDIANMSAVTASTIGYCQEIFELHPLHLPRNKRKLIIGTSSYHCKVLPQEKHLERPVTIERPVLYRNATTFKKLPTILPKIKRQR